MSGEKRYPRPVEELPDAKITNRQRDALKALVRYVEAGSTEHELMYLACAFEDAANRKKAGR